MITCPRALVATESCIHHAHNHLNPISSNKRMSHRLSAQVPPPHHVHDHQRHNRRTKCDRAVEARVHHQQQHRQQQHLREALGAALLLLLQRRDLHLGYRREQVQRHHARAAQHRVCPLLVVASHPVVPVVYLQQLHCGKQRDHRALHRFVHARMR